MHSIDRSIPTNAISMMMAIHRTSNNVQLNFSFFVSKQTIFIVSLRNSGSQPMGCGPKEGLEQWFFIVEPLGTVKRSTIEFLLFSRNKHFFIIPLRNSVSQPMGCGPQEGLKQCFCIIEVLRTMKRSIIEFLFFARNKHCYSALYSRHVKLAARANKRKRKPVFPCLKK